VTLANLSHAARRSAEGQGQVSKEAAQLNYGSLLSWAELKCCS
jgi:hypothetical protein